MKVENLNKPFYIVGNSSNLEKGEFVTIYIYIYIFQNISFMTMQNIQ